MATLQDFDPFIRKTVRIRALKDASNRTRARIKERGGSNGSFIVEMLHGSVRAFNGRAGVLFTQTSENAGQSEPWRGWLLVEEIELVP